MNAPITGEHVLTCTKVGKLYIAGEDNAACQLIADSEERLSSENKALRQSLRELGQERLEESIRADSEAKAAFDWKNAANFKDATISSLLAERDQLSAELDTIKRGHGELGRYEKLRLKYADAVAELAKERARMNWLLDNAHDHKSCDYQQPVILSAHRSLGKNEVLAAIDASIKEDAE